MKRSTRMGKIADVNLAIEKAASASFATVASQFQFHENQLKQLMIYRAEYQEKHKEKLKNSTSINQIRDYQHFSTTLDKAIEQQKQMVDEIERQLEYCRTNWLEKKQDTEKISRVTEKFRLRETADQIKAEQKESDELSLQRLYLERSRLSSQ